MTKMLLRVDEAAEMSSMSRSKIYTLINAGEFPAIRIGHSWRISVVALEEWIRNKAGAANGDGLGPETPAR